MCKNVGGMLEDSGCVDRPQLADADERRSVGALRLLDHAKTWLEIHADHVAIVLAGFAIGVAAGVMTVALAF